MKRPTAEFISGTVFLLVALACLITIMRLNKKLTYPERIERRLFRVEMRVEFLEHTQIDQLRLMDTCTSKTQERR